MNHSEALLKYALCFCMMFLFTGITRRNKSNRLFDDKGLPATNTGYLLGLQLAGILWLGLVPIVLFDRSFNALVSFHGSQDLSWVFSFIVWTFLAGLAGFSASRQIHIKQENDPGFSGRFINYYFAVRILFLCAYELFFRGLLLFDCIAWFGILPAIMISTGLTVLIHVFTNKKEMWACIPFGIVLCSFSIALHAVWPAMVLHLVLSLSYEIPPIHQFFTRLKLIK